MQNAVAFLNAAWFLFLLTTKGLTEHQHKADTQSAQGVSQVCVAQYCTADSQELGAELFVQHHVSKTKLPLQQGSWHAHEKLTEGLSTQARGQETSEVS